METLKIRVDSASDRLKTLVYKYNGKLRQVVNAYNMRNRLLEVVSELEHSILRGEYEIPAQEADLELMKDWMNDVTVRLKKAVDEYIQTDITEFAKLGALKEQIDDSLDEYEMMVKDSAEASRKFVQDVKWHNQFVNSYETQVDKVVQLNEMLNKLVQRLKKDTILLENELGFSIGSNMIDWCYSTEAEDLVENMPQLRFVKLEVLPEKGKMEEIKTETQKEEETEESSL